MKGPLVSAPDDRAAVPARSARVRGRRRLAYAVGLFFLPPLMGEYLLENLKFTELYLHLSLPDARGVACPRARIPVNLCLHTGVLRVAAQTTQPFPPRSHLRRGTAMALRDRYATAALLAALALALVALAGCGGHHHHHGRRRRQHRDRLRHRHHSGRTGHGRDVLRRHHDVAQRQVGSRRGLQERRADRLRGQEAGHRRRGYPDARRQRLPADRRPGRQASHHRLPGIAERAGQGARHRQARRDHLGRERRRRQRHQRPHVHHRRSGARPREGDRGGRGRRAQERRGDGQGRRQERRRGAEHELERCGPGPGPMYSTSDMAGAAKAVPIEPGQLDITANVVVVFELK